MKNPNFTILYVDDEPHNLITFKASFRRKYKILTAESGDEGLKVIRKNDVDLVISDQRMPGMTGVEFLEQVAREYPDTIRVILTGFSDVESIINAINNGGIFRYITKPWSETEISMTIENGRQLYDLEKSNQGLVRELRTKLEEQERTLRLFGRYVPEAVVQKSLQESEESIFEGVLANVAVLFCDIRGFTSLSENLPPKSIVSILNDYYSLMTSCVRKHNGAVCQFVGDEVFAVFGAPIDYPNNEANAVFCAIEMIHKLGALNEKYKGQLKDELIVGIGVHAGEAVTGNVGSEDRINYAVTGNTVNIGRRIESLSKDFPNSIIISEPVYQQTSDLIDATQWKTFEARAGEPPIYLYLVKGRK